MSRKKLFTVTAIAAVLIIIIAGGLALSSCSDGGKFDKYMQEGRERYELQDYEKAAASFDSALSVKPDETAYLLLADCFLKLNNIDGAIRVLYSASMSIGSANINAKLEEIKTLKVTGGGGYIIIAGLSYQSDSTELNLSSLGLSTADTQPLAKFAALESLDLALNNISDIKYLSGLKNLRILYLDDNPIKDMTPLYSLKALTYLSIKGISMSAQQQEELKEKLPGCTIRHDAPNAKELTLGSTKFMSDVKELNLSGQSVTDITILAGCADLTKLDLSGNAISDITALGGLKALTDLNLSGNEITDIRPLSELTALSRLDLSGNPLTSITAITGLVRMTDINLSGCALTDITPLLWLSNLKKLGFRDSGLSDLNLDTLSRLKSLTELNLENNDKLTGDAVESLKAKLPGCLVTHSQLVYEITLGGVKLRSDATEIGLPSAGVTSLEGLEKFTKLSNLMLADNKITDITPLSPLKDLQRLDLDNSSSAGGNKVSDLSPLHGSVSLRVFSAIGNSITDLSPLSGCTSLTELHLSLNPLHGGLWPLASLTSLTVLSLDNTGITDITALSALTNLTYLSLDGNGISNVSALKSLTRLQTLYLSKNSLTALDIIDLQVALPGCKIYSDLGDMIGN